MSYGYLQAKILVGRELKAQHSLAGKTASALNVPLLLGPVGGGKTALARGMAEEHAMFYAPINSGENSDPTDVAGVPVPSMIRSLLRDGTSSEKADARGQYMEWVLNRYATMACSEPVFLFFDDLDKAPPKVQGALLGITGNRMFRDRPLHPGTLLMGAGNRIDDDAYANEISESLRTRMTIIEMVPDVRSFSLYGTQTGEINPAFLGYLQWKPEHLHKWQDGVNRFPTPRGWWEASKQTELFPDPFEDVFGNGVAENWKGIVARKLGDPVANDFWAWFEIISKVDVQGILINGTLPVLADPKKTRMTQFACVYAVSQVLNKDGVSKKHTGLAVLVDSLEADMRVAFLVQLSGKLRADIAKLFPHVASTVMKDLVG
jgi:hypothetical protein